MLLLLIQFWHSIFGSQQNCASSKTLPTQTPEPKEKSDVVMNNRIGKRLQNKLLKSVYDEDPDTHYSANTYATIFKNVLSEEKSLRVISLIMMIKQSSVDPIKMYYGFPVSCIKKEYIPMYGLLEWNKFRLECATAMSKKRKKKNEQ